MRPLLIAMALLPTAALAQDAPSPFTEVPADDVVVEAAAPLEGATDSPAAEGETTDGETTDGETTDGETTVGETTVGETTVGEATDDDGVLVLEVEGISGEIDTPDAVYVLTPSHVDPGTLPSYSPLDDPEAH